MNIKKLRIIYTLSFVFLLITEVIIALFVNDSIIRPYGGDVIVIPVVYSFVRIFIPDKFRLMPIYVFIFAVFVEIMQYIDIVSLLNLENNVFLRTIIGTSFSWIDILCYFIGSLPLILWEIYLKKYQSCNDENIL